MRTGRGSAIVGVIALSLAVSSCGNNVDNGVSEGAQDAPRVTVYSSLPMRGPLAAQSRQMVNGIKLALMDSGAKIGDVAVKYQRLDDAGPDGMWDDGLVTDNARTAIKDRSTIAYIGEQDSSASALSIPILNEAGILQVSPFSSYIGLTEDGGIVQGEPDKYYPSGRRTFARLAPDDRVQARAQVANFQRAKCSLVYLVNDQQLYGTGLAREVERVAATHELKTISDSNLETDTRDFGGLVSDVQRSRADCLFFAGSSVEQGVALWRTLGRAQPNLRLFAGDRMAEPAFASRIGRSGARTLVTSPLLPISKYPPMARKTLREYRKEFKEPGGARALYGYEAMASILQAIRDSNAKGTDPASVVRSFFRLDRKDTNLGEISFDDNGGSSLRSFGSYKIVDGKLKFDRVVSAR